MPDSETFNRFLARQPILTRDRKFFAYEILSRYAPGNYCRPTPGSSVSAKAMDELFLMGVRAITEGLPAFMNRTREFLLQNYLTLLPKEWVVGEILETVAPDDDVLATCCRMKDQGSRLALDDYCDLSQTQQLLEVADFVKIDVLLTTFPEREKVLAACHRRNIPVVAEKVETDEQFHRCAAIGYDYFLRYFFCRPPMAGRRSVPAHKTVYLELLQAANDDVFDPQKISGIFRRDVSLSYRLVRYLNSAAFGFRAEIRSIPQALTLPGEPAMRKWISLVSVAGLGDEVADGLLRLPLLRAMFCESIGRRTGLLSRDQ